MEKHLKKDGVRRAAVLGMGAALYALLYALGSQIDESGYVQLVSSLARFALAYPLALAVLYSLFRFVLPRMALRRRDDKAFCTVIAFALIFASFVPLFLIEYPGSFMYDIQAQAFQIAWGEYSRFHPLAHTLLIRACLSLQGIFNSLEKCAAVYSVISMMVMAVCFSLVCASVSRSVSRRAARICVAFFCLYPAHMAFASNCTKDGMFAAFFALFAALCMEDACCGGMPARRRVLLILAGVMACLMRNNMIYAMLVWAAVLLLFRKHWRMALCTAAVIAVAFGINAGLAAMTDADEGSVGEMLSVPVQQLARARLYADEVFTQEERELMDAVCTYEKYGFTQVWQDYTPTLSDPVKSYLDLALLKEKMPELAAMWLRIGRERPDIYLDAFLNLVLTSIYPYSGYRVAQPYIEIGIQPGALTAPFGQPPMVQPGRFERIRTVLYERMYRTGMDDVPVLRWLFNSGFIYWMLMMFLLYDLYCGNWSRVTVLLLPLLLYGTFLLGPVMQGRYLYPFVCCFPLFALRAKRED